MADRTPIDVVNNKVANILDNLKIKSDYIHDVIDAEYRSQFLYDAVRSNLKATQKMELLSILFSDHMFDFISNPLSTNDHVWLHILLKRCLISMFNVDIKITKILVRHGVFSQLCVLTEDDYSNISIEDCQFHFDDAHCQLEEFYEPAEILTVNAIDNDFFRVSLQLRYSARENLSFDIYIDEDYDCYLTLPNYLFTFNCHDKSVEQNDNSKRKREHGAKTISMVKFLLSTAFIDYHTCNRYKKIHRTLSCVETAIIGHHSDMITFFVERYKKITRGQIKADSEFIETLISNIIYFLKIYLSASSPYSGSMPMPINIERGIKAILNTPFTNADWTILCYVIQLYVDDQYVPVTTEFTARNQKAFHAAIYDNHLENIDSRCRRKSSLTRAERTFMMPEMVMCIKEFL